MPQAHLAGKRHQRKVECGAGPQVCALCNITTTSAEHMALHLRGKAHLRKQKIAEIQARQARLPGRCIRADCRLMATELRCTQPIIVSLLRLCLTGQVRSPMPHWRGHLLRGLSVSPYSTSA